MLKNKVNLVEFLGLVEIVRSPTKDQVSADHQAIVLRKKLPAENQQLKCSAPGSKGGLEATAAEGISERVGSPAEGETSAA